MLLYIFLDKVVAVASVFCNLVRIYYLLIYLYIYLLLALCVAGLVSAVVVLVRQNFHIHLG